MKKWNKDTIKNLWRDHKIEIIGIGGGAIIAAVSVAAAYSRYKGLKLENRSLLEKLLKNRPSRVIPETDGFKILDIGEDLGNGCIVWMDGCKLSDCGKLGEGLSKIERVVPDMMVTMAILGEEKLEL